MRVLGLSLVLLTGSARATTCWVLPSVLWPAGLRDVPRKVRPILLNARATLNDGPSHLRIRLLDAGPSQAGDVLAPVPDIPEGAREVPSHVKPFDELGDSAGAVEMVPDEGPLSANHRFLITIEDRPSAAFATGERLELTPARPELLQFLVYDVIAPSIYVAQGSTFEVPRHDAEVILLMLGPERWPRTLVLSLATDDRSSGRFLVHARAGRVSVGGSNVCGLSGPPMEGPGRAELLVREWTPAGLTAPVHVNVEIPKPVRDRDLP